MTTRVIASVGAVLVLAALTGCTPRQWGMVGVQLDEQSNPVVVLAACGATPSLIGGDALNADNSRSSELARLTISGSVPDVFGSMGQLDPNTRYRIWATSEDETGGYELRSVEFWPSDLGYLRDDPTLVLFRDSRFEKDSFLATREEFEAAACPVE